MDDLLQLARKAVEAAQAAGAEFADASASRTRNISIEIERGAIKSCEAHWGAGVSVRAYVRGGQGSAGANGLDEAEVLHAAATAAELAQTADADPAFVCLPSPAPYPAVDDLYDPRISAIAPETLIAWAMDNVHAAREIDPTLTIAGGADIFWSEAALVNNLGIQVAEQNSHANLYIFTIARRGNDAGSFYEFTSARMLDDFHPEGIGVKAAREAIRFLGARDSETAMLPIVFGPRAARSLLYRVAGSANAESIQRGRSWLAGGKGQQIASEVLTVVDNPLIPRGAYSAICDGEGYPHAPLMLIKNGVLQSWLHSSYTAQKSGEANTGHSTRGGIAPTNLVPTLGERPEQELIADLKEGIYLAEGAIQPNEASGDFSTSLDFAYKIENGQIVYPLKNTMISGNIRDLLMNLDAVSSDYREDGGIRMPALRAKKIQVAGAE